MDKDKEFWIRLRETFKIEAKEHLQCISLNLVEMEKEGLDAPNKSLIDVIFRETHSLKGAARAVNMSEIELMCQTVESVFSDMSKDRIDVLPDLYDVLQRAVDFIEVKKSVESFID